MEENINFFDAIKNVFKNNNVLNINEEIINKINDYDKKKYQLIPLFILFEILSKISSVKYQGTGDRFTRATNYYSSLNKDNKLLFYSRLVDINLEDEEEVELKKYFFNNDNIKKY